MPPQLNFHQIKVRFEILTKHPFIVNFFKPLNKKYRFWSISASIIIGLTLYSGIDIGLGELVRQNSDGIHMLSAELLNELGPQYIVDSNNHAEMIDQYYTKYLEQRKLAGILRLLYPTLSPQKALDTAHKELEEATKGKKDAEEAIYRAGQASHQLYKLSKRFPRSPIAWLTSEDLPDWLGTALEQAFDAFHEQVDKLEKAQDPEVAVVTCRATCSASRKTILLLFLARLGYDNEEKKIERFKSDLKRAHECTLRLAEENAKDEVKKKLFNDRARNKKYRLRILEAMLDDGDMDRVHEILSEWIDFATDWREATKALEEEKGKAAG